MASAGSDASGEKYYIDESFISKLRTAECGFQVHRVRDHDQADRGRVGKHVRVQDAGTDRETLLADGRTQLAILGRFFPANSFGQRVEVDGEVVRISGRSAYDPAAVCARLAP